jgi:thymidylate synthase ThyX
MINDSGHRPWADHRGEIPRNVIVHAPDNLKVSLDAWGPKEVLGGLMGGYLQANWGDNPCESSSPLNPPAEIRAALQSELAAFEGKTLPQVLEGITFWFTIDGVTRACTHQLVRTRFAAIMQHGGRDNDWRHRPWVMPETIYRAILEYDTGVKDSEHKSCLESLEPLDSLVENSPYGHLGRTVENHLEKTREIYAALVDAGIPWQDARRLLPIGTATYLHAIYNYQSLKGFLANRLEHIMDWEINCVAQLMLREIRMQCPAIISTSLKSHSDAMGKAAFAGLDSWPPDQKYPVAYEPKTRMHGPEQMPFFILSEAAMSGGPVEWIKTNGVYPEDLRP